jgi:hypothetical protein
MRRCAIIAVARSPLTGLQRYDPEAQAAWAALIEDEKRFIDLQHSPLWFGEEKVMFSEQAEA